MDRSTGKIIKELRVEKHLSQRQLAEMIPISRQAVSKWERNERIPDASSLLRLSDIFNVTINELLIGKRIEKPSISELENATLELIDASNKKIDKSNNKFLITLIIACLLSISFLSYYFINSYNSVQVYKVYSIGNKFHITNGLFIITKEKSYLRFGNLKSNNDYNINSIKIAYKKNNIEKVIYNDKDLNMEIVNTKGNDNYYSYSDIKLLIKSGYIVINYDDNKEEKLKINIERDFINQTFIFKEYNKEYNEINYDDKNNNINSIDKDKVLSIIKSNWIKTNNSYFFKDNSKDIELVYFESSNQIVLYEKGKDKWHYDLYINNIICIKDNNCEKEAINEIKKYILNE